MSKTPNYDAKVKAILYTTRPGERVCALTGEKWVMTEEEIGWYKKFNVPPFRVAPITYMKQMCLLLTGYSWWWNKHAETGEPLITATHPHTPYRVIKDEEWYGRDFSQINTEVDPARSLLQQLYDLTTKVPVTAHRNFEKPVNSIARHSLGDEDSYFVEGTISKRALYSADSLKIEDCAEVNWSQNINNSYNILQSSGISQCRVVRESRDCRKCDLIFDCRDCEFCFMSSNKRHKKYLWYNEQLTKEEWEKRIRAVNFGNADMFECLYREFKNKIGNEVVWPENFNEKSEESSGEYLKNCVRCKLGWYCDGAKDSYMTLWGNLGTENCAFGCDPGSNDCFGNMITVKSSRCKFSWLLTRCQDCEYCLFCEECENCFGCVGLRRKKFHIFNKSYSEEEYWKRLDGIKSMMFDREEYGNALPDKFAQTLFRHSGGAVTYTYSEKELDAMGALQFDDGLDGAFGNWEGKEMHDPSEVPADIDKVGNEWIGRALLDKDVGRPYAIHPAELAFYRRMHVPVRRGHFIKRVEDMWREINMAEYVRCACGSCKKEITVAENKTYPNRKVYCRQCYLRYLEEHG